MNYLRAHHVIKFIRLESMKIICKANSNLVVLKNKTNLGNELRLRRKLQKFQKLYYDLKKWSLIHRLIIRKGIF